jgi:uncharacterized protein YjiS (DUF1127 family)
MSERSGIETAIASHAQCHAPRVNRAIRASRLHAALSRLVESLTAWRARIRSRRLLASFDDRMLRDIGIDRARVERESSSSFWRCR